MLTPNSIFRIIRLLMIVYQFVRFVGRNKTKLRTESLDSVPMDKLKFIVMTVIGIVAVSLILRPMVNLPLWLTGVIIVIIIAWKYSRKTSGQTLPRDTMYSQKNVKFFCPSCGINYTNSQTESCTECGKKL